MRNILILLILFSIHVFPQKVITKTSDEQPGGIYLPAEGRVHVLFIFAQFPDDNYDPGNVSWKKNDIPLRIKENTWVDAEWTGSPTPYSLTDYFNDMSFGKLKFTGKSISVTAPQTRQWYIDNKKRLREIHSDILAIADKQIDFAEFDNWKRLGSYNHLAEKDGIVDMIFFVWRNIHLDIGGEKPTETLNKLGFGWFGSTGVNNIPVDDGARKISSLSGVTIQDFFSKDPYRFSIHEFAHYLLGGNEYHSGYAFWAVLNGYGARSYMINSFERHRLGWSDIQTIPDGTALKEITLKDFITTGDAARIEINAKNSLYFYLENHQRISKWDEPSAVKSEKGIYVLRRDFFASDNKFMQLIPADGKYMWEVTGFEYPEYFKQGVPVFKRLTPNRKEGYLDTEFIPFRYKDKDYQPWEVIFYEDSVTGKSVENPPNRGDGRDAFRPGYKNVFSPWSNPPSSLLKNKPTGIGFYIKNIDNGLAVLNVYTDSSVAGPPSKPDRPALKQNGSNVLISWIKNEEPDAAGYKIYEIDESGREKLIGNPDINTTEFKYSSRGKGKNIKIKISCVDKNREESIKSEIGEWIN